MFERQNMCRKSLLRSSSSMINLVSVMISWRSRIPRGDVAAILIIETSGVCSGPLNMKTIKKEHAIHYGRVRQLPPGLAQEEVRVWKNTRRQYFMSHNTNEMNGLKQSRGQWQDQCILWQTQKDQNCDDENKGIAICWENIHMIRATIFHLFVLEARHKYVVFLKTSFFPNM